MKSYLYTLSLIVLYLALGACEDVVDAEVSNAGPRLVVDASINWEKGTSGASQSIILRESTAFFDNNPDVPVTGASVSVTKNDDNTVFAFEDQNDGSYTTNSFVAELNQSYSLQIEYNGQTYRATETLIPVTGINRVEQTVEGGFDEEEIQLKVFFDDPAGETNYYFSEFYPENLPVPTLAILDDEFTDGNENFIEFDNENLVADVQVAINLYGVSERYFNFINILLEQQDADGPFQTTPVELQGNCFNINDADEEVLGYFRLSEVDRTLFTISE